MRSTLRRGINCCVIRSVAKACAINEDTGAEELVIVLINDDVLSKEFVLEGTEGYNSIKIYETSDSKNFEEVMSGAYNPSSPITVVPTSVTTIVLSK